MKRYILLCFIFSINFILFSQNLYDVNYDAPEIIKEFDAQMYEFQKIYIQYEDRLRVVTDSVRKEERDSYQKEIESLKRSEEQNINNAINQIRSDIYASEIQNMRTQETERLTKEITETLTKELSEKISLEYEEKKQKELIELEKNLRKEISKETETTTKRIKYVLIFIGFSLALVVFIALPICFLLITKKIKSLSYQYLEKLKTSKGEYISIQAEIETKSDKEKSIATAALNQAQKKYEIEKSEKEKEKKLQDLYEYAKSTYEDCIRYIEDKELTKGLCVKFLKNINGFDSMLAEIFDKTNNFSEKEKKFFKREYSEKLKNLAIDINGIQTKDKEIKKKLLELAGEYENCAKKFKKGEI